jgi:hypothetical protein
MTEHLTSLMIDIETLGKYDDCVILSIACVPFTLTNHDYFSTFLNNGLMIKFNVEEQIKKYHRSVSEDVVNWWRKQSKEARDANLKTSPNDMTVVDGLIKLSKFIGDSGYNFKKSYVWTRGVGFDCSKIENLYETCTSLSLPFNVWKVRDSRTYIDILCGVDDGKYDLKIGTPNNFIAHNCLHDAALEAARLNEIYYYANLDDDIPF